MVNFVIKKDGAKVPFELEKVKASIAAACDDAEIEEGKKGEIVEKVSAAVMMGLEGKDEVSSSEIKEKAMAELEVVAPEAAQAWKTYEEGKHE